MGKASEMTLAEAAAEVAAESGSDPTVHMSEVIAAIDSAFSDYAWYQPKRRYGFTSKVLRWLCENDRRERQMERDDV